MIAVKTGTATKRVARLHFNNGTLTKRAQNGYIRTTSGLKKFFSKLAVTLDKTGVSGSVRSATAAVATSSIVTATVDGGTGTVTHSWTQVSGDAGITITNSAGSQTAFSASVTSGSSLNGVFHDTVTDATGATSVSASVTAALRNFGSTL